jgi:hypothetical protein
MRRRRKPMRTGKFGSVKPMLGNAPLYDPLGPTEAGRDITARLPLDLQLKGFQYIQFTPGGKDPWVLYDSGGKVLGRWEREPSFGELWSFVNNGSAVAE